MHVLAGVFHQNVGPVEVVPVRPAGDAVELVLAIVAAIAAIAAVFIGVIFRPHLAATTPVFVADAPEFYLPGFGVAVLGAEVAHRALTAKREIFDPLAHLFDRAAANVAADVGLAA